MSKRRRNLATKTDYETGQDNVDILGFDLHNPVFFISAAAILSFAIGALAFPETASLWLNGAKDWTLNNFDWFFCYRHECCVAICCCGWSFAAGAYPLRRTRCQA